MSKENVLRVSDVTMQFEKEFVLMCTTPSGILTFRRAVQSRNNDWGIFLTLSGSVISVKLSQFEKTP